MNNNKRVGRMNEELRLDGLSGGRGWARVGLLALSERKGVVECAEARVVLGGMMREEKGRERAREKTECARDR